MVERQAPIMQSAVSFEDWFMPLDFLSVDYLWVINTFYDFNEKRGECRKVKIPTDSFLNLGEYETLEIFKLPQETINVHQKWVEKMKEGKEEIELKEGLE